MVIIILLFFSILGQTPGYMCFIFLFLLVGTVPTTDERRTRPERQFQP